MDDSEFELFVWDHKKVMTKQFFSIFSKEINYFEKFRKCNEKVIRAGISVLQIMQNEI